MAVYGIVMDRARRRLRATTMASVRMLKHNCPWYCPGPQRSGAAGGDNHGGDDDADPYESADDPVRAPGATGPQPHDHNVTEAMAVGLAGPANART